MKRSLDKDHKIHRPVDCSVHKFEVIHRVYLPVDKHALSPQVIHRLSPGYPQMFNSV